MRFRDTTSFAVLGLFAAVSFSSAASAQVFQTGDNTPLPQPVAAGEIKLSMDLGWKRDTVTWKDLMGVQRMAGVPYGEVFPEFADGDAVTLAGLFKWRKEAIDPVRNALTAPGYFSPSCGFTGELVLRGGNCNLAFGWYNVNDPNDATVPAANEIYELIPSNTETYMQCMDQNGAVQKEGTGFCPFGWDRHHPYNLGQVAWTPKAFNSGLIASDPNYKGKYVAFALIGKPSSQCTQTKYSIAAHNQKNGAGQPWITTLIWQSTIDPEAFYIGFEDLAMTAQSWKQVPPGQVSANDGDFNDFVYYISGISCEGGGQACDTGRQGACSLGRTDCKVGTEAPTCRPIIQPGNELCDNVDNDCNGIVDDGNLCSTGQVCDKGMCVQACSTNEFPCPGDQTCTSRGLCVPRDCATLECPQGQACRAGKCMNACDGVTCPSGQECQLGRCVDPCAGVTCPASRVCERGLCVSDCKCRGCAGGLTCGDDGRCLDMKCSNVTCPAGQKCQAGACKDPCEGVVCPGGAKCTNGTCGDPMPGSAGSTSTAGNGGIVISTMGGGTSIGGGPGNNAGTGAGNGMGRRAGDAAGCGCRLDGERRNGAVSLFALGFALLLFGGRRRRRPV